MSEANPAAVTLPITASARQGYCLRLLLVGLGMWAAAAWFAFDAGVTYPRHNVQQAAQKAFTDAQGAQASAQWPAYADAHGFTPDYNEAAKGHTEMDIMTQWGMGGGTALLGLMFVAGFAFARRRFVRWDGAQLSNHRGVCLDLSQMEQLDLSRWDEKGMAVVRGKAGQIALDDWKTDPDAAEAIVAALLRAGVPTSRPPAP